jgi:hypothetical protein
LGHSFFNNILPAALIRDLQHKRRLLSLDSVIPDRALLFNKVPALDGSLEVGPLLKCLQLRCLGCSKTIAICDEILAGEAERLGLEYNFEVIDGRLEFFGFCPDCRGKKP